MVSFSECNSEISLLKQWGCEYTFHAILSLHFYGGKAVVSLTYVSVMHSKAS